MKRALFPAALLATSLAANAALPEPFPLSRYDAMAAECPFAVAAPPSEAPPEEPQGVVFVTGMTQVKTEDGQPQDVVFLRDRSTNETYTVKTGEPAGGFELVSVAWSDQQGKSTAVVKNKSGKTETVKFSDEPAPAVPVAQPRPPGAPLRPGAPPVPGAINPVGRIATPQPAAIPRPGVVPQPGAVPAAGPQPANANNSNQRTRVRVINSKQ